MSQCDFILIPWRAVNLGTKLWIEIQCVVYTGNGLSLNNLRAIRPVSILLNSFRDNLG